MELSFIDEHVVTVAAPPDRVWRALAAPAAGRRFARAYATLVGAEPRTASGEQRAVGSTMPGFEVAESDPDRRLVLAGRHRFSTYTLTYLLDHDEAGTRLRARTHAAFPGLTGRLYRLAVIASGAHRMLMARHLAAIRRAAE